MPNKNEEQLKLLNEILSIATFNRDEDGSLRVETVKGDVTWVGGDVFERIGGDVHGTVKGNVHGTVEGDVTWVEGNVRNVGGNVKHLYGEVEVYVKK